MIILQNDTQVIEIGQSKKVIGFKFSSPPTNLDFLFYFFFFSSGEKEDWYTRNEFTVGKILFLLQQENTKKFRGDAISS